MPQRERKFNRILLKLSGEALTGDAEFGIDPKVLDRMAVEVGQLIGLGVQVGMVIGGGICSVVHCCMQQVWNESLVITWGCWLQ